MSRSLPLLLLLMALSPAVVAQSTPSVTNDRISELRRAAEQGDARAQYNLALMYDEGEGVPKNLVDAYFWFNLAAAQGIEDGKRNRDISEKQMTREQIAEAQRRSAAWKPKTE